MKDASNKGTIFDIQHYAIYDGPGIRTNVFLKGCPLRCAWCHNPESQKLAPEMAYRQDLCVGCGACVEACPEGALTMGRDGVVRDREACRVCDRCVEACPEGAMERIGRETAVEAIVEEVVRDAPYYESSKGGATVSGGEPTVQADFLLATLGGLKAKGIHTALETCGFFKSDLLGALLEVTDLFLFDLKEIDDLRHKETTGVSNERILANLRALLERAGTERVTVRVPVIPGANADDASIDRLIAFLGEVGYDRPVHLMPYNAMARTKWEKIGRGDEYRPFEPLTDEALEAMAARFAAAGLETVCNH